MQPVPPPTPTTPEPPITEPPATLAPETLLELRADTPLGLDARSVNGRIQPRGRPTTWWFELGETVAYDRQTPPVSLPPKIGAWYAESWNDGFGGWAGGMSGTLLELEPAGGVDGGYVAYEMPGELDVNHADGIGANALVQYLHTGEFEWSVPVFAALGGGDPDLRGARITAWVRGQDVEMRNAELVFWAQSTPNVAEMKDAELARWSNWAYTGALLGENLLSGSWEQVSYTLENDTNAWTYAGHYVASGRETYIYRPLDEVLAHLNGDLFHMLVLFEYGWAPLGTVAIDEIEIAWRNESVLVASNGGSLVSSPAGDPPERLTDGWRNGVDRTWRSAADPVAPLEFVWALASPVAIDTVQLHQDPDRPSRAVEILTSTDGVAFEPLFAAELAPSDPSGPNHNYLLLHPASPRTATHVKLRVLSGWQDDAWGLGELEVFGTGAVYQTDDDWYGVTADFEGLTPGATYHWRLVAESEAGQVATADATFQMPATTLPLVGTGTASRLGGGNAMFEGRIAPLGLPTNYWFEYGLDPTYGSVTGERYAGLEITPRTVTDSVAGLISSSTYHFRLVAVNATGTAYGEDVTFVAQ